MNEGKNYAEEEDGVQKQEEYAKEKEETVEL